MTPRKKQLLALAGCLIGTFVVWLALTVMKVLPQESAVASPMMGFGLFGVGAAMGLVILAPARTTKQVPAHQQFVPSERPRRTELVFKPQEHGLAPADPAAPPVVGASGSAGGPGTVSAPTSLGVPAAPASLALPSASVPGAQSAEHAPKSHSPWAPPTTSAPRPATASWPVVSAQFAPEALAASRGASSWQQPPAPDAFGAGGSRGAPSWQQPNVGLAPDAFSAGGSRGAPSWQQQGAPPRANEDERSYPPEWGARPPEAPRVRSGFTRELPALSPSEEGPLFVAQGQGSIDLGYIPHFSHDDDEEALLRVPGLMHENTPIPSTLPFAMGGLHQEAIPSASLLPSQDLGSANPSEGYGAPYARSNDSSNDGYGYDYEDEHEQVQVVVGSTTGFSRAMQDLAISNSVLFSMPVMRRAPRAESELSASQLGASQLSSSQLGSPQVGARILRKKNQSTLGQPPQDEDIHNINREEVEQMIAYFENKTDDDSPAAQANTSKQDLRSRLEALRRRPSIPTSQPSTPDPEAPNASLSPTMRNVLERRSTPTPATSAPPGIRATTPAASAPVAPASVRATPASSAAVAPPRPAAPTFNSKAFDVPTRRADQFYQDAVRVHASEGPSKAEPIKVEVPKQAPSELENNPFTQAIGTLKAEEMNSLWRSFVDASRQCGRDVSKLRPEVFREHLKKNYDTICAQYRCDRVSFSVKIKEGKPALSARPVA